MQIDLFLAKLKNTPADIMFADTMATVEANYEFTPTQFDNGNTHNAAEQNQGSCKLFAFAQLQQLSEADTLACFGQFYRDDVLPNPTGSDHQNIRNFMVHGWTGINFSGTALVKK